ncbi:hypothetical protein ACIA8O_27820 [Kitasatospora sp. NPDC051853]|uniref:hypothetical protein n=1 Tax=Kitasatospora sp. NPDC051853 TaxID=3364058 RepID=UPI0037AC49DF
MYLIHVELRQSAQGGELPPDTAELIRAAARPSDRLEHVVVHERVVPHPVVGLFLIADDLHQAEQRAAGLADRAVHSHPTLLGWRPGRAAAPLIAPAVELGLAGYGLGGRNGPRPFPSTVDPFHQP